MLFAIAEMRSSLEFMFPVNGCCVMLFNAASRELGLSSPDSVSYLNEFAIDNYCNIPKTLLAYRQLSQENQVPNVVQPEPAIRSMAATAANRSKPTTAANH